jgi:hypothetical protein
VSPSTVAEPALPGASVVTLTLGVVNRGAAAVDCQSIAITIPSGPDGTDLCTSADMGNVIAATGAATPWAIAAGGRSSFLAMPLPPVSGLPARASIEFVFSNIVVSTLTGTVTIGIVENTTQQPYPNGGTASITVVKS